ncbi:hypothetical protein [Actibacterium sp. 188UL27-1]|uniref:hypothetical protein n=1 Tax=Actibacterium sp. 188UL27-1 TaxID=2786961 RepID=UPI00195B0393|nr:hypothetical protein [Actibacterium sp. 188UL27-1]MBM7068972.1 hypothetical protein [Actibacterium sp. 188UL27-1]
MDPFFRPVLVYRWIVFLLAASFAVYQIFTASYDGAGGPFRYLTNWALLLSFYSASRMLAVSEGRITRPHLVTASVTAVLNAMVVIRYWRLYLQDPSLVSGSREIDWVLDYYLHLVGPLLQLIDAMIIARAFRRHVPALGALLALVLAYAAWAELFVGPLNRTPIGSVTSGLPYPFLNDMEAQARAIFYCINLAVAWILYVIFAVLAAGVRRLSRPPIKPSDPPGSPDSAR